MFEAFIYHSSSIIELLIVLLQCMAINSEEKYFAVGGMDSTTLVFSHSVTVRLVFFKLILVPSCAG
jgi:hypothetical protein